GFVERRFERIDFDVHSHIVPPLGADQGFPINTGDPNGPTGHLVGLGAEWGHYVTVYVKVDALEAALDKAGELGGKVLVEPIALPEQGRFAWIAAPEGQIIGLWETA
ncbi:MAG: hypothetical protein AAFY46_15335, partial [Planctomycetota bacterium]